jgi:predicted GNAT family acetyltransferase
MADAVTVEHDQASHRFVVRLEGHEAFLAYRQHGAELDFYHTFVPEAFRGRGVAERMVGAGFEYAKASGFTVRPTCPYVSGAYLKRHPEYESLTRRA